MVNLSPILLLAIAAGGALGAISRYLVQQMFTIWLGPEFPWGTLIANITGCLLIGLIIGYWITTDSNVSIEMRSFVVVGFLGAFTTFSAFSLDTIILIQSADIFRAGLNVMANLFFCLLATMSGFWLAKHLFSAA